MRNYFSSVKFKISVSILSALLLGIVIAALSGGGTSPLTSALNTVLTPLNTVARTLQSKLGDFSAGFKSSSYYREQIAELQSELDDCRQQLVDREELQHKLSAYEEFLDVKSRHSDFKFTPAAVILRDMLDINASFTINRGRSDGIAVNDPVIVGTNLVGVVKELDENSAVVYSLFHPDISVSAYEIRTREDCYTESDASRRKDGELLLSGLSRSTPGVAGGMVCTSGIGGLFPRDLVIGTVTEVVNSEENGSAVGIVTPERDIREIVDVFVITDFDGKAVE